MFSSTKSGWIKISRLLIGGAIVLLLLLSLDQVFYLVEIGSIIYLKVRFDPATGNAGNGIPFVECHPLVSIAENSGKFGL
ncbi:MAG: hypothetical protein J2P21_24125 [Chloracidobacterium sp.]|nr:hypothetical protein [Chloracidobacterium sp.]